MEEDPSGASRLAEGDPWPLPAIAEPGQVRTRFVFHGETVYDEEHMAGEF